MNVRVLGDAGSVRALRLAGLTCRELAEDEAPEQALDKMLAEPGLGVLLVTSPVAARCRERLEREAMTRRFPLVLTIPGRGAPAEDEEDLAQQVAKLIGTYR